MKKLFALILLITLSLGLISCKKEVKKEEAKVEQKTEVVKEEVKVEKQIATSILDGEDEPKKKAAPTKKSTTKKA